MATHIVLELDLKTKPTVTLNSKCSNTENYLEIDLEILSLIKTQTSTVGHKSINIIDENVRKSNTAKNVGLLIHPTYEDMANFNIEIKKMLPTYLGCVNFDNAISYDNYDNDSSEPRKWDMISYEIGDKFIRHSDGKKNIYHYATMLLFPPNNIDKFSGGEFILYKNGASDTILYPHLFTKWTIIVFPINIEHECLTITNGTRYLFKSEFELPKVCIDLFENIDTPSNKIPISIDHIKKDVVKYKLNIDSYLKEMETIKQKIVNEEKNIDCLNNNQLNSDMKNILDNIKNSNSKYILLILNKYYNKYNLCDLSGEDRLLYNSLIEQYPNVKLKNINDVGYERQNAGLNFMFDTTEYDIDIMYQKNILKHMPGELSHSKSEYNDQKYDISLIKVSAFILSKSNPLSVLNNDHEDNDETTSNSSDEDSKYNDEAYEDSAYDDNMDDFLG